MQAADFSPVFSGGSLCCWLAERAHVQFASLLPFHPVRLACLIVWVYLCLYFVQIIELSPLVPKKFKPPAKLVALFAGPLLLLVLLTVDAVRKSARSDQSIFEALKEHIGNLITSVRSRRSASRQEDSAIKLLDSSGKSIDEIYGHSAGKSQDGRILDLTEQIIADGLDKRASDILIDPQDEVTYTVRFRIDGVLRTARTLRSDICKAVVNSIKAVSSMDISEKRRPQDGGFIAKKSDITASFRVASAGVLHGEKLSIRILNQMAGTFTLTDVGFTGKQLSIIKSVVSKPSGMVLMCGPTGSGKTTTMYAMLNTIDRFTRNVITVEDPIESVLPEASQIEINPKADITFAKALRSILRQDPDVICVGEIRDEETAEIALRAAQTGHLVLATVHCDSNAGALIRLLDLGISPILLSSGLSLLVSQRLLRVLCDRCKKPAKLSAGLIEEFEKKHVNHAGMFEPVGCKHCGGTGYYGRTAIGDILVVTDEIRADIANNEALITQLRSDGKRKDRTNLRRQGLKKVALGITSLEELKRVVG